MTEFRHSSTTLPVVDLDRAKRFYGEKLGLTEAGESAGNPVFRVRDGGTIELVCRKQPTRADHTVVTFEVDDIEQAVQDLEGRGVRFEDYHQDDLQTDEHHIARLGQQRAAWFKDTEGNILCIHQE